MSTQLISCLNRHLLPPPPLSLSLSLSFFRSLPLSVSLSLPPNAFLSLSTALSIFLPFLNFFISWPNLTFCLLFSVFNCSKCLVFVFFGHFLPHFFVSSFALVSLPTTFLSFFQTFSLLMQIFCLIFNNPLSVARLLLYIYFISQHLITSHHHPSLPLSTLSLQLSK